MVGLVHSTRQGYGFKGPTNPLIVIKIQIQKTFNEVYRSFNATQSPFIVADFILPTGVLRLTYCLLQTDLCAISDACDINVSPDKRTIFLHSEGNMITALKVRSSLCIIGITNACDSWLSRSISILQDLPSTLYQHRSKLSKLSKHLSINPQPLS